MTVGVAPLAPGPTICTPRRRQHGLRSERRLLRYGIINAYNRNQFPLPEYSPITPIYTNNTPLTILPGQTVSSAITITDANNILAALLNADDIQVSMNVKYPTDSDLQFTLVAPDGMMVNLASGVGGTGADFDNTVFYDGGYHVPRRWQSAPFSSYNSPELPTNSYPPASPLSALEGVSPSGAWRLKITDTNSNPASGAKQLNSWSLSFPNAPSTTNYVNLFRDPNNPFVNPSSLQFVNIANFTNTGVGARYMGIAALPAGTNSPSLFGTQGGVSALPNDTVNFLDDSTNYHAIVAITDPTTGHTRLIVGDDQGVFTGVENSDGSADSGPVGSRHRHGALPSPARRNGNLQLAQLNSGTAQPDTLAAQITGALYYATGLNTGSPQSTSSILSTGNITWQTNYGAFQVGSVSTTATYATSFPGTGKDIETDPTGTGTLYQFRLPQRHRPGPVRAHRLLRGDASHQRQPAPEDHQPYDRPPAIRRHSGRSARPRGQWGNQDGFNFAVNPIDPSAIVTSSIDGNIFRTSGPTTGYGVEWFQIAQGSQLDGSNANALAYGRPQPGQSQLSWTTSSTPGLKAGHDLRHLQRRRRLDEHQRRPGRIVRSKQIVTDPTRGSH